MARYSSIAFDVRKPSALLPLLCRLFWVLLLVLHVSPLVGVLRAIFAFDSTENVAAALWRAGLLGASAAFFLLKVVDVSWLHLGPSWRARVSATIVVALLHVGVMDRAVSGTDDISSAPIAVMLGASGAACLSGPRRWLRRIPGIWGRITSRVRNYVDLRITFRRVFRDTRIWSATHVTPIFAPRGPPSLHRFV